LGAPTEALGFMLDLASSVARFKLPTSFSG